MCSTEYGRWQKRTARNWSRGVLHWHEACGWCLGLRTCSSAKSNRRAACVQRSRQRRMRSAIKEFQHKKNRANSYWGKKSRDPSMKESSVVLAVFFSGRAGSEATLQCERQESNGFRIASPWLRAVVLDLSGSKWFLGIRPASKYCF